MPATPPPSRFRSVLFWTHLVCGLVAGTSIGIMCFTGATLAFENELVSWAERDARRVEVPAGAQRLPIDELQKKFRVAQPEARPSGIAISHDPRDAVVFQLGRDGAFYANPYTGEVRTPASTKVHDFLHLMEDWHRVLALGGDHRPIGKAINGACNLAFFGLAVTGLYIWMPRSWSWRSVRAVALFKGGLSGKARDFNWHNVIGLWSAPVLIVLTLTAVPMSYRWGTNLIFRLAGEEVPAQVQPGMNGMAGPVVEVPKPEPGTRPLSQEALIAAIQAQFPRWELLTMRTGGGPRGPGGAPRAANQNPESRPATSSERSARPDGERPRGEGRTPQAVTVTVKEPGSWPRTATTTVSLNPYTGEVLKHEDYADLPTSRQIRSWTRFLHTGQALGLVGQLVAGLACLGGCVLVYTGFALAWRRFFGKRPGPLPAAKPAESVVASSSELTL
jgi:uncharacterized iron-regulated membrane protein